MSDSWTNRVRVYLDQLDELASSLHRLLEKTEVETTTGNPHAVQLSVTEMETTLVELEQKVAQREVLLRADDAAGRGMSLQQILRSSSDPENQQLADRAEQVAETITDAHHRAISLFVCQYHLLDCSSHIIRLLSSTDAPTTYNDPAAQPAGGGLFNESA